jgi:uncharacterized membrane protein YbhN (UPF0104 family)
MTSYLAGMSVAALPGGSVLPARLAQEHGNVHMREAASGLFVGFAADAIAVSLVAYAAMLSLRQPGDHFIVPIFGLIVGAVVITMARSERVWQLVGRLMSRWALTRRVLPKEEDVHRRVSVLMRAGVVSRGVGFSVATTIMSAAVFYVLANALTFTGVGVRQAIFVHAFSESAAMVLPVPAGIGVSDSSMAGLMGSIGIGWVRAMYVVIAIRSVDLLFKTVFGSCVLLLRYHRMLAGILKIRRRAGHAWRFGLRMTLMSVRVATLGKVARHHDRQPVVPPVEDYKRPRPVEGAAPTDVMAGHSPDSDFD